SDSTCTRFPLTFTIDHPILRRLCHPPTCARRRPVLAFSQKPRPPTEIYTLSLHDALPISDRAGSGASYPPPFPTRSAPSPDRVRSEEHTSELQSRVDLVCRLRPEKEAAGGGQRALVWLRHAEIGDRLVRRPNDRGCGGSDD